MARTVRNRWGIAAKRSSLTMGRWLAGLLGVGMLLIGCGRSSGPVRHEVHKPTTPSSTAESRNVEPPVLSFPDIPKVPEEIQGASPPIGEDAAE